MSKQTTSRVRAITSLILFLIGLILSLISLAADFLGLDITPGFGMVQMFQLLIGLTCLTLAAFLYAYHLRPAAAPRSLQADIGIRLGATGLIFTYVAGLSDLIGIGTHVTPNFDRPFVGELQLIGIALGIITILAGLFLYHTSRGARPSSSIEELMTKTRIASGDEEPASQ